MSRTLEQPQPLQPIPALASYPVVRILDSNHHESREPQTLYQKPPDSHGSYGDLKVPPGNRFHNASFFDPHGDLRSPLPLPDWPLATHTWGFSWSLHVYGFSVLFVILAVVSTSVFLRFRARVRRLKIVYNTLILLTSSGIFRTVLLLLDPYGSQGRLAGMMVGILTQVVYPLLCASFGLTQVMLLRVTNVDVGHSRFRTLSCLLGCTLSYLFVVVVIETLVFFQRSFKLLLLLDSGCFIVWSMCLSVTFICSGFRLTQYASEAKRAHKELNAFCNQRRSASSGFAALYSKGSSATSQGLNTEMSTSATADTILLSETLTTPSEALSCDAFLSPPMYQLPPAAAPKSNAHVRLSRPKLKISNQNHMTVTIATEDEDESTSSTEVDEFVAKEHEARKIRKLTKYAASREEKHKKKRSRSKTSSSVYRSISVVEEIDSSNKCLTESRKKFRTNSCSDESVERTPLTNKSIFPTLLNPDESSAAKNHTSELSVGLSSLPEPMKQESQSSRPLLLDYTTLNDRSNTQTTNVYSVIASGNGMNTGRNADTGCPEVYLLTTSVSGGSLSALSQKADLSPATSGPEITQTIDRKPPRGLTESLSDFHDSTSREQILSDPNSFSSPVSLDQLGSSLRENGYLADTENLISGSAFSSIRRSPRKKTHHARAGTDDDDLSPVQSSNSKSEDEAASTVSPVLSERLGPTTTSASLSLFRIRQSRMVERAVQLTYLLTFLFIFACLLQLYTVFGVYGVLGSVPRPDPWPWLIFQTIFRATEFSIGLTVAAIAFITLNHRHQRAKRRHQQQQHLITSAATRDCIV